MLNQNRTALVRANRTKFAHRSRPLRLAQPATLKHAASNCFPGVSHSHERSTKLRRLPATSKP